MPMSPVNYVTVLTNCLFMCYDRKVIKTFSVTLILQIYLKAVRKYRSFFVCGATH